MSSTDRRLARSRRALATRPPKRLDEAITAYDRAVRLKGPGWLDAASGACRELIALRPDLAEPHYKLAHILMNQGRLDEAIDAYRRALALEPDRIEPRIHLPGALMHHGRTDEAITAYRRVIALRPDLVGLHSDLLYVLHFHPDYDAAAILAEHRRWARRFAEPLAPEIRPYDNDRSPTRNIRVGFLGSRYAASPQGQLLQPLFSHHDRAQYEFVSYSDTPMSDDVTAEFMGDADAWHDIVGQSDKHVAERIRADRIDILVDLTMHTPHNCLLVFARKPAPVQVTGLATLIATTGVSTMDYRLTDPYLDPPRTDGDYTERSIRLRSFWCYAPPGETPPVSSLPALRNGYITFGGLNASLKMSRPTQELWAKVLQTVPRSRLVIHVPSTFRRTQTAEVFRSAGVARDRVEFTPWVSHNDYVQRHHDFDVSLDTQPYAGGTSTMDALWMGVPVVTLAGRTGVGRGGVSILSNVGLPKLIARTPEQYVESATKLSGDRARLAELRAGMRARMQGSPLMDGKQYARDVEAAFRQMWQTWCAS